MTTETATAPLTLPIEAAQLRALRSADSVVFRLHAGQATIEANRDAANSADGFDAKTVIHAGGARVSDYTRADGYHMGDRSAYSAFHMEHSGPKYNDDLRTLVGRMAKGDTVALTWTRGNDSELVRDAGLHVDDLRLVITKPSGRVESYLVASQTSLDNTARMVRVR